MNLRVLLFLALGVVVGMVGGYLLAATPAQAEAHAIPAWLEITQRICTSVGGLGTFVALIYVVRQFNILQLQSTLVQKSVVASLESQVYARLDSFNKFIVEHAREYELLGTPYEPHAAADHRSALHHLCDLGYTFFEQVYKHHVRYKLVNTEDWEEWLQNMNHFFAKPYVRGYWQATRIRYARSFEEFVDGLLSRTEPERPTADGA